MADSPVNLFADGAPILASDLVYLQRSPFGVGDDRKATISTLRDFVIQAGPLDPNGVVTGTASKLYLQQSGNYVSGFTIMWYNVSAGTTWKVLFGAGTTDPNGVVTGVKGATWNQIPGDGTATPWINVDGGTTWV